LVRYIQLRILAAIPVLIGVSIVSFSILHLIPGDPARILMNNMGSGAAGDSSQTAYNNLRQELGLNDPLAVQYLHYAGDAARGDLGYSYVTNRPVADTIFEMLPSTLELTVFGLGIAILLGVVLGIIAALHRNSWIDSLTMVFSLIGLSMPGFWLGFLLIDTFSFRFEIFPASGTGGFKTLVLPAVSLGLSASGVVARLVRSTMLEVLRQEYIVTARSKGLRERSVVIWHALRNAVIPVITVIGLQFGALLSGAVITETVFARKGIGRLAVDSILNRDYPMVQGTVLVAAFGYLIINLLTDLSYAWLDPRIKYE
jgi:ABC-type dipeptide/oligopeptide/nickel transport system permease component